MLFLTGSGSEYYHLEAKKEKAESARLSLTQKSAP